MFARGRCGRSIHRIPRKIKNSACNATRPPMGPQRDSKVRNNVLQNLTSSELCSVFDLKAPRDILGIGYKQVNKHFAFPLIRGGHKKADALYPYAQQVTGDGIKQRSKVLKDKLFGIFTLMMNVQNSMTRGNWYRSNVFTESRTRLSYHTFAKIGAWVRSHL